MKRLNYVVSVASLLGLVLTLALAPWGGLLALAQTVVATVPVGSSPLGVGVNPTTNRIYVANSGGNTVSVIDGATNTVVATVPVGFRPLGVGVNPATNRIYVANFESNDPVCCFAGFGPGSGTVSVIDGATNTVAGGLPGFFHVDAVGVNATTNHIYVLEHCLCGPSDLLVFDGATNGLVASIFPVGSFNAGVAVNATTNRVYVPNFFNSTLSVIDGATNSIITSVSLGSNSPTGVGVNATANRIYVANPISATISVIDGATNGIVATVPVGAGGNPPILAAGVGVNPTTSRIYVANLLSGTVSVIQDDIDTRAPEAYNQFSPASGDVQLFCRDLGDGASGCADGTNPVAFTAVPTTAGQLRTYTVKDNAGNTLVLNEQVKAEVSALEQEVTASITSLQYCTGACSSTNPGKTITPPANQKKFEAEANASGPVSSLEQKLILGSKEVEAEWTAAAGQTTITVLVNDQRTSRVTKPGQVLLRLATDATQTPVLHIEDSTGATF